MNLDLQIALKAEKNTHTPTGWAWLGSFELIDAESGDLLTSSSQIAGSTPESILETVQAATQDAIDNLQLLRG